MLIRAPRRRSAVLPAALGLLLTASTTPVLAPPAHADSLEWARRLGNDFRAAQQVTRGKGVTVAIVADGVDGRIGTLRGKVRRGRDFAKRPGEKKITGTLVATLIGGGGPTHDSPLGIRGLAPAVSILPVRVEPSSVEAGAEEWFRFQDHDKSYAKGIRYAADEGAQVIYAVPYTSADYRGAVESALAYAQSKGSVVVAGNPAGNKASSWVSRPAGFPGAIGVGALGDKGKRLGRYTGGDSAMLLSAPGFRMPSIGPGDTLWTFTGAIPAACFVAAAAALVRAEYPKLPPQLVARAIAESARHPKGGYDADVGFGIVNPRGALERARELEGRSVFATASQGVISEKTHFGGGPVTIEAVRYDTGLLAGYSGLAGGGLLAIVAALVLAVRGRRRRPPAVTPAVVPPPEQGGHPGSS